MGVSNPSRRATARCDQPSGALMLFSGDDNAFSNSAMIRSACFVFPRMFALKRSNWRTARRCNRATRSANSIFSMSTSRRFHGPVRTLPGRTIRGARWWNHCGCWRAAVADPRLQGMLAFHGTFVGMHGRSQQVDRTATRLHFQRIDPRNASTVAKRIHDFFQNILVSMLIWTFNPRGLRGLGLRRDYASLWISRRTLIARYGNDAAISPPGHDRVEKESEPQHRRLRPNRIRTASAAPSRHESDFVVNAREVSEDAPRNQGDGEHSHFVSKAGDRFGLPLHQSLVANTGNLGGIHDGTAEGAAFPTSRARCASRWRVGPGQRTVDVTPVPLSSLESTAKTTERMPCSRCSTLSEGRGKTRRWTQPAAGVPNLAGSSLEETARQVREGHDVELE